MAVLRRRVSARELSPELLDAVRAISATNDVPAEDVEVSIIDPYDGPIPEVDARAQPPNPLLNRVLGLLGTPREGPAFDREYQGMFIEADTLPERRELTPHEQALLRRQQDAMFGRVYGRSAREIRAVTAESRTAEEATQAQRAFALTFPEVSAQLQPLQRSDLQQLREQIAAHPLRGFLSYNTTNTKVTCASENALYYLLSPDVPSKPPPARQLRDF